MNENFGRSITRACQLCNISRSSNDYICQRQDELVIQRLLELAPEKRRYGCRRLHELLRREGVVINHKKAEWLYRKALLTFPSMVRELSKTLDILKELRGLPETIVTDNGSEFTRKAMGSWALENKVYIAFICPGKLMENGFVESINGRYRDECLNENWFKTLKNARDKIEAWREEYNSCRFHSSFGMKTLQVFSRLFPQENKGVVALPINDKALNEICT